MKKIIQLFVGLLILALTFAAIYFASAIYDTANKQTIDTYFFQPNSLSDMRPGVPVSMAELGEDKLTDLFIEKFLIEYFYVLPDNSDIAARTASDSTLSRISSSQVFTQWLEGEAKNIEKLAEKKVLRTVSIKGDILKSSDSNNYWVVDYELSTWDRPNDIQAKPTISSGKMFLNVRYEPGLRPMVEEKGVQYFLDDNVDPVSLFKFMVNDIIIR